MHSPLGHEASSGYNDNNHACVSASPTKVTAAASLTTMEFAETEILEFSSTATATYLNEGAANIVYHINVPHVHTHTLPENATNATADKHRLQCADPWHGKLLRFRKDLPTTTPTLIAHNNFLRNVAPLFSPEDLIDIKIASIKPSGIVHKLNKELREAEEASKDPTSTKTPQSRRPLARHGVFLADDDHALLITDMSPSPSTSLIQFKPKWLHPSASAPPNSKRCRTCALHARRNHMRTLHTPPLPPKRGFCPLDLMSPSERDVRRAAAKILHLASPDPTSRADLSALHRFVHWARRNPLLRRVRDLQMAADPAGILNVGMGMGSGDRERQQQMEANLQIAMTLRDVTLFLLVPRDETRPLVARLGDLDLKSTAKMEEWVRIERELVEEGWYEGVEVERGMSRQALDCWLYPEEWTPEGERRFLVPRTVRV